MIRNKLLRKYFLLAATIVVMFVVLGFLLSGFIARALRTQRKDFRDIRQSMSPTMFARLVDSFSQTETIEGKKDAVKKLNSILQEGLRPNLILFDNAGQIIYNSELTLSERSLRQIKDSLAQLDQLKGPYDYVYLDGPSLRGGLMGQPILPMPPPSMGMNNVPPPPGPPPSGSPPPFPAGGPPPPGMGGFFRTAAVRLQSGSPLFLLISPPRPDEAGPMSTQEKLIPFLGIGSLILSLLIGIGATLFLISISVFKRIKEADQVISALQSGNLKARFKVKRKDEFGEAMLRFNRMADEIEKLVEHLKFVELARTKLLQELAHDLRTPISALKSLLETLESKESKLEPKLKQEIIALSLRETSYFERLIEDLLLLSQVSEPNYDSNQEEIDLRNLLNEEVDDQVVRQKNLNNNQKQSKTLGSISVVNSDQYIEFIKDIADIKFSIFGQRLLLRRMLRNIFSNAVSFAKKRILVQLKESADFVELIVQDDGPGFLPEQLQNFGNRKASRQVIRERNSNERLSIGLGSVVIKKICELHRGELSVENRQNTSSETGARICIRFSRKPLS